MAVLKVGVIGPRSSLGRELCNWYTPIECDITSKESVRVNTEGFDVIINCAAKTDLDWCETHKDETFAVNMRGVGTLRNIFKGWLVHLSTSYVYADKYCLIHKEDDLAFNPINVYSAAKLGADIYLSTYMENTTIVRTMGLFGSIFKIDGMRAFFDGNISSAPTNLFGQCIHVKDLALCIKEIIDRKILKGEIINLVHEYSYMSRWDLYTAIRNLAKKKTNAKFPIIEKVKWQHVKGLADRPEFAVLSLAKAKEYDLPIGTIHTGLARMI